MNLYRAQRAGVDIEQSRNANPRSIRASSIVPATLYEPYDVGLAQAVNWVPKFLAVLPASIEGVLAFGSIYEPAFL